MEDNQKIRSNFWPELRDPVRGISADGFSAAMIRATRRYAFDPVF